MAQQLISLVAGVSFTDARSVSPARPRAFYRRVKGDVLGRRELAIQYSGDVQGGAAVLRLVDRGRRTNPNACGYTRLKCRRTRKAPRECHVREVFPAWVSSSWRQCSSLARQMWSLTVMPLS